MRARKPSPSDFVPAAPSGLRSPHGVPEDFIIDELRKNGRLIDEAREQPRLELPLPSYEILPPRRGEPAGADVPVPGSTVIIIDI